MNSRRLVLTMGFLPVTCGRFVYYMSPCHSVAATYLGQTALFDYFVGDSEQRWRNREAQRLRRLKIEHQLELGRLLDW